MAKVIMIKDRELSIVKMPEDNSKTLKIIAEEIGITNGEFAHIFTFGNRGQYALNWNPDSEEKASLEISHSITKSGPVLLNGKVFITQLELGFAAKDDDKFVDIDLEDLKKHFVQGFAFHVLKRQDLTSSNEKEIDESWEFNWKKENDKIT